MKKMSDIDKLKNRFNKAKEVDLEFSEKTKKYFNKIRLKGLKKLIFCYMMEWEVANSHESFLHYGDPNSVEAVMKLLNCSKREAYDYLNTKILIGQLGDNSLKALSESLTGLKKENLKNA